MSISGVRTAYTRADVQDVHARLAS